jgi:hypothetical protein
VHAAPFGMRDPLSELKRRLVADVLIVAAHKLGDPVSLLVKTEVLDPSEHVLSVPTRKAMAGRRIRHNPVEG